LRTTRLQEQSTEEQQKRQRNRVLDNGGHLMSAQQFLADNGHYDLNNYRANFVRDRNKCLSDWSVVLVENSGHEKNVDKPYNANGEHEDLY
jgi:hypothetical protein